MPSDPLSGAVAFGGRMFVLITATHERFPPANLGPVPGNLANLNGHYVTRKGLLSVMQLTNHVFGKIGRIHRRKSSALTVISSRLYTATKQSDTHLTLLSLAF